MGKPIVELVDVRRVYGRGESEVQALRGVDLAVDQGESIAIVGRSGSGKSTLMHSMALLDRPTSGEVRVKGSSTAHLSARQIAVLRNKSFGFVFQQFFLVAGQSVLENVTLPLAISGIGGKERRRRGMEVLEALEIGEKYRARANDLSGGQKQRVAIARALVNKPSLIFADEPTGNLDEATGRVVENLLFSLNQEQGITLVVVTHDPELAVRCDRTVTIQDGALARSPVERKQHHETL